MPHSTDTVELRLVAHLLREHFPRLVAQREELWELSKQDHESIDELVACLRWAVTFAEGSRDVPGSPLDNPTFNAHVERCKAAIAVHDAVSDEIGEPRATLGTETETEPPTPT